jgi:hypothetical protein
MNGTPQTERPPLVKIVGTVADIILASAPNKPGKIELESGKMLHAFADKLQMVKRGEAYDFGCEPTEFRGVLNHTVRVVRAAGGSDKLGAAPSNYVTTAEVLAQRRPQPQRAIDAQTVLLNSGQPARQEPRGDFAEFREPVRAAKPQAPQQQNGFYRPTHPVDAVRMWVCAHLTKDIEMGRVGTTEDELVERAIVHRNVWERVFPADDQG